MTALDTTHSNGTFVRRTSRQQVGLFSSLAGVMLTLKPTSRGSPQVPDWLRRDVGLPPAHEARGFWEVR